MRRGKEKIVYLCFIFRMGIPLMAFVRTIISLSTVISVATLNNLGYSIEKYDESPGVYYENKGVSVLYNIKWRTVVYVKLNKIDNQTLTLRQYVHHVELMSNEGQ